MASTSDMTVVHELETPRLDIGYVGKTDPHVLHRYLVENRHAHAQWEPLRGEEYYSLQSVVSRFETGYFSPDKHDEHRFALFSRDKLELVGIVNFTNIIGYPFQACHLGFSVAAKHEGLGLMREGLQSTITHMFEATQLNRVMANFLPRNFRSACLLNRLGFRVEGFAKDYLCINGQWEDHILTSVLRSDWFSGHQI